MWRLWRDDMVLVIIELKGLELVFQVKNLKTTRENI